MAQRIYKDRPRCLCGVAFGEHRASDYACPVQKNGTVVCESFQRGAKYIPDMHGSPLNGR
jgi:hypothetical protein